MLRSAGGLLLVALLALAACADDAPSSKAVIEAPTAIQSVQVGEDAVFSSIDMNQLAELKPVDGAMVRSVMLDNDIGQLIYGNDRIYAVLPEVEKIVTIEPSTLEISAQADLSSLGSDTAGDTVTAFDGTQVAKQINDIAINDDGVWVVFTGSRRLVLLDATTLETVTEVDTGEGLMVSVAAAGSQVFALRSDRTDEVLAIDAASASIIAQTTLEGRASQRECALALAGDEIQVATQRGLERFDAANLEPHMTIEAKNSMGVVVDSETGNAFAITERGLLRVEDDVLKIVDEADSLRCGSSNGDVVWLPQTDVGLLRINAGNQ